MSDAAPPAAEQGPSPRPRRAYALVALFTVVLALAFHPESLGWGETWKLPGWDATRVFWADLVFMRRSLLEGAFPLWNPYDRAGYAFAAEPQSGLFDPITWLVVVVSLPLGSCPSWLIALKALLYYVLGATGVHAFVEQQARLRKLRVPPWATAVGIMIYVVGGRMDKLKDQSGLWPSAWAPWLLVALAWALQRPSWRRGVGLGLVGGLALLSGYPPIPVRLAILMLGPLALLWIVERMRLLAAGERRGYLLDLGRMFAVSLLVFAGLVAAQVLATAQVLPMTMRAELEIGQVLASQIEPRHALGLFAPGASKVSMLLYSGVVAGMGVLAAVATSRDATRWLLLASGVLGFLLACGGNAPLLPLLADLPGFRSFRITGHFVVLSAVACAVLAPFGLEALARGQGSSKVVAPVLAALGAAVFFRFAHEPTAAARVVVLLGAALVGVMPFLARALAARPPWQRAALGWTVVGLLAVDVFLGNRGVAEILQPPPDETRPAMLAAAVRDPDMRMADFSWADNRPGPRTGVRDLVGARPALTDRHYMEVYEDGQRHAGVLRAMGVERAAFGRRAPVRRRLRRNPEAEGMATEIYEVPDPWPRVFFTTEVDVRASDEAAREALREGGPRAIVFGADAQSLAALTRSSEPAFEALAL
ncbi:MAG: hypothetical protein KC431_15470, partial [Myxococcales bacterium]|nr:hypothetical protein [Myxococcales bacterium]